MALPVEILFGIYLGILTGIIPALVAGILGFVFRYFTGVTIPGFGVVVLALAIAGVNGGLLALNDPTVRSSERAPAILTSIIVVLMLSLYAHAQGDKLGASVPRRLSLRKLRDRTLSADVIERVGGRGQVRVTVAGDVGDMEGYPALPAETCQSILEGEWTFPADLPLVEIEKRFEDRLKTELSLADVSVTLDERAHATVNAAPPMGGLSKRVPAGKRAISLSALLPTGVARGEAVRIISPETAVEGTVLSAKSTGKPGETPSAPSPAPTGGDAEDSENHRTDGGAAATSGEATETTAALRAGATTGGEGRITVAVDRSEANALLRADRGRAVVLSRGTRREFELVSLLRRAGKRFRKVTVVPDGPLDGNTIGEVNVREAYDVVVAARHDEWRIAPRGGMALSAGDELFVVGTSAALDRFTEAAR